MKNPVLRLAVLLTLLAGTLLLRAQQTDPAAVRAMVEARNYIFKAQLAYPQNGRSINLTTEFDLTVRPDSVIAFLPYFGRAYTAPVDPTDGGIKFTSADFDYKPEKQKKRSWEIVIIPKDATGSPQLNLTIFDNGTASLRVNSINRQGITFRGYVVAGRADEKKAF